MKVEREINSKAAEKSVAKQILEENHKKIDFIEHGGNSTMRTTNFSNFDLDKIEENVNKIMQKYCTPAHQHVSRFEPSRHSAMDRAISSLSNGQDAISVNRI
jgi:hypothetical protein